MTRIVYSHGAPLITANFFERTNRFECKVKNDDGDIDVYCPNTGSMLSLVPTADQPLRKCVLSVSTSGKRKHIHTLEAVYENEALVGIHSRLANDMVESALKQNLIPELVGYSELNREVTSAPSAKNSKDGNSRTDFELVWREKMDDEGEEKTNRFSDFAFEKDEGKAISAPKKKKEVRNTSDEGVICRMLIEVKSVTLSLDSDTTEYGNRNAQFPDCVSARASKHLRSLMDHLEADKARKSSTSSPTTTTSSSRRNDRACVFFLVQRDDVNSFSPCHLDPAYTAQLELAIQAGVEVICYTTTLDPSSGSVTWGRQIPFQPNPLPRDTAATSASKAGSRKRKLL